MTQYAQRHQYPSPLIGSRDAKAIAEQISNSLDLPYRKDREYQAEVNSWIWLG